MAWGPGASDDENDPGSVERRFQGKQRELSVMGLEGTPYELEAYDFGARFYIPELATWMSADPLIEPLRIIRSPSPVPSASERRCRPRRAYARLRPPPCPWRKVLAERLSA